MPEQRARLVIERGRLVASAVQQELDALHQRLDTELDGGTVNVRVSDLERATMSFWASTGGAIGGLFNFGANPVLQRPATGLWSSPDALSVAVAQAGLYLVLFTGMTIVNPSAIARHDVSLAVGGSVVQNSLGHSTVAVPYVRHAIVHPLELDPGDAISFDTAGTNVGPYTGAGWSFLTVLRLSDS